nr:hypothetical protein [Deltaproteobacteria bacterium]
MARTAQYQVPALSDTEVEVTPDEGSTPTWPPSGFTHPEVSALLVHTIRW